MNSVPMLPDCWNCCYLSRNFLRLWGWRVNWVEPQSDQRTCLLLNIFTKLSLYWEESWYPLTGCQGKRGTMRAKQEPGEEKIHSCKANDLAMHLSMSQPALPTRKDAGIKVFWEATGGHLWDIWETLAKCSLCVPAPSFLDFTLHECVGCNSVPNFRSILWPPLVWLLRKSNIDVRCTWSCLLS